MKNICAICHLSRRGASVLSSSGLLSSAEHQLEQQMQNKKKGKKKEEGERTGRRLYIFGILILYKPLFTKLRV